MFERFVHGSRKIAIVVITTVIVMFFAVLFGLGEKLFGGALGIGAVVFVAIRWFGFDLLDKFFQEVEEAAKLEKAPSREARNRIGMILGPK